MGRLGDLIVSIIGGVLSYIVVQLFFDLTDTNISADINLVIVQPISVNKHVIAISCLFVLFILSTGIELENNDPFGTLFVSSALAIFFILISVPVSYVLTFIPESAPILPSFKFIPTIYGIVFLLIALSTILPHIPEESN